MELYCIISSPVGRPVFHYGRYRNSPTVSGSKFSYPFHRFSPFIMQRPSLQRPKAVCGRRKCMNFRAQSLAPAQARRWLAFPFGPALLNVCKMSAESSRVSHKRIAPRETYAQWTVWAGNAQPSGMDWTPFFVCVLPFAVCVIAVLSIVGGMYLLGFFCWIQGIKGLVGEEWSIAGSARVLSFTTRTVERDRVVGWRRVE